MLKHNQKYSKSNPISSIPSQQNSGNKQNVPQNLVNIMEYYHSSKITQKSPSLGNSHDSQIIAIFNHLKQKSIQSKLQSQKQGTLRRQTIHQDYHQYRQSYQQLINKHSMSNSTERFLKLIAITLQKESLSLQQGIELCQQYQIINQNDLINIQQNKQALYEWPPLIRDLLMNQLGQLKIQLIKKKIRQGDDLIQNQEQILNFLIPKRQKLDQISLKLIEQKYEQFKQNQQQIQSLINQSKIIFDNKFIKKIHSKCQHDKNYSVLIQKNVKKIARKGLINYQQLKNLFSELKIDQKQMIHIFKYLYFKDQGQLMSVIDKTKQINIQTIFSQLFKLKFHEINLGNIESSTNFTTSRFRQQAIIQQGNFIVQSLLKQKQKYLQLLHKKDKQVQFLKKKNKVLQLDVQSTKRQCQQKVTLQKELFKRKYDRIISKLKDDVQNNARLAQWYRHQLECVVQQMNSNQRFQQKSSEL